MNRLIIYTIAVIVCLSMTAFARYNDYDTWDENYTVQGLAGAVQYSDLKFTQTDSDNNTTEVDLAFISQFGGTWATIPKGDRLQFGLECSLLFGVRLDKLNYISAGGGGLEVSISTSMWIIDLAGGPYVNLWITDSLRLYGGVGPLLIYSDYDSERTETGGTADDTYENTESVLGVGVYARTGIEVQVHERGYLGIGARVNWADVDFSDVGGRSKLQGIAGFITYTAGL